MKVFQIIWFKSFLFFFNACQVHVIKCVVKLTYLLCTKTSIQGLCGRPSQLYTFIWEWSVARLVIQNGHQKCTCYNEISIHVQNMDTVHNQQIWNDLCKSLKRKKIFTFTSRNCNITTPIWNFKRQHVIANGICQISMWSDGRTCLWSWNSKVPTRGPQGHTYTPCPC